MSKEDKNMKITLEFKNEEDFFKSLPRFASLIGFAGQFATFKHAKGSDEVPVLEDPKLPEAVKTSAGVEVTATPDDMAKVKAADAVRQAVNKAEEAKAEETSAPKKEAPQTAKEPAQTKEKQGAEITKEQVKKSLTWLARAGHKDDVREILKHFGARNFPEFEKQPQSYAEAYKMANQKIAGYGGSGNV